MNSYIEHLNHWAERALQFAWPMLWQSSLLIVLIFALDYGLRGKVRAAIRYGLWLIVLVKLVVPPSLALPTGLAWWLRQPAPVPAPVSVTLPPTPLENIVVADANLPRPALPLPQPAVRLTAQSPPTISISGQVWALGAWALISFGLFIWLGVRWRQVAKYAGGVGRMPVLGTSASLNLLLEGARRLAGVRRAVPCRLIDRPVSPVVCGLFRPVVLLPRSLAEQLPAAQLRAILLHELIHLRRRDVWVNCLQALLQIIYWWHPLLWLANARIRRLREEAVDDAVMLALADESDAYAPTLLEVAKLSFSRPLTALGLVGILESRRGLRQRIERLMNFKTPRRAGLSVVSLLGIAALTALAVPMGEGPASSQGSTPTPSSTVPELTSSRPDALDTNNAGPPARSTPGSNHLNVAVNPTLTRGMAARQAIMDKLVVIRFDEITFDRLPLSEVVRILSQEARKRDPERRGLNFLINPGAIGSISSSNAATEAFDMGAVQVPLSLTLRDVRLADVLEAIVRQADQPIKYSVEDYAIVFSQRADEPKLLLRRFNLDSVAFAQALQRFDPASATVISTNLVIRFFIAAGVDLDPQTGKAILYKESDGTLLVRAPADDMNRIEALLLRLNEPLIVNLAARVAELVQNGRLLFELRQLDRAEEQLNKALLLKPDHQGAAYLLGLIDQARRRSAESRRREVESSEAKLLVRSFKVDPKVFCQALEAAGLLQPANGENRSNGVAEAVKRFFNDLGVDLEPPKSVFFNDRNGTLLVRVAERDLDFIESAVQSLNSVPPQVTVKVKFAEIGLDGAKPGFDRYLEGLLTNSLGGRAFATNSTYGTASAADALTGILTDPQYRELLRNMEDKSKVSLLFNDGSVTTLSGRQAQLQVVELMTVATNINPQALKPPGVPSLDEAVQTLAWPCGPVLDVIPVVNADGYTVHLNITASLTEFLGYEDSGKTDLVTVYVDGKKRQMATPRPKFRVRQLTTQAIVWDGQTVVLSGLIADQPTPAKGAVSARNGPVKKSLIVFVTPTIIDAAGNRLHPDDEQAQATRTLPSRH